MIVACIGTLFVETNEKKPYPMEIWFYDDQLVVYRDKTPADREKTRREYNWFQYSEISEIDIHTKAKQIDIYGVMTAEWYEYKNGILSIQPSLRQKKDNLCTFGYDFAEDIDFQGEIEAHCPLKVTISND